MIIINIKKWWSENVLLLFTGASLSRMHKILKILPPNTSYYSKKVGPNHSGMLGEKFLWYCYCDKFYIFLFLLSYFQCIVNVYNIWIDVL